jgi:hypothetical protein
MGEPIRQTFADARRERLVARAIEKQIPRYILTQTPPFHPTDFHVSWLTDAAELCYMGDLEIKWFRHSSSQKAVFNFNKLQNIMLLPPRKEPIHKICFRYDDGLLIIPADLLADQKPYWFKRRDTQEQDLVVVVDKSELLKSNRSRWLDVIVNERNF